MYEQKSEHTHQYKIEHCPIVVAEEKMNDLGVERRNGIQTTGVPTLTIVFEREYD